MYHASGVEVMIMKRLIENNCSETIIPMKNCINENSKRQLYEMLIILIFFLNKNNKIKYQIIFISNDFRDTKSDEKHNVPLAPGIETKILRS